MRRIENYFFDLGFAQTREDITLGVREHKWTIICYVLFCLGIVAREVSAFPKMTLIETLPSWRVPVAAFMVGLALFPPVLRWVSSRHEGKPSVEHVLWCFTFGFFWSLVAQQVADNIPRLF